jgi:mannose-6-phosphate isomerase
MLPPLRFRPIYQERVWGGQTIASAFSRALPPAKRIGESWEIVDRLEAQSAIDGGILDGWTLRSAIEQHSQSIMGPQWNPNRRFPILVKWLDCRERLSLQVHPPADIAPQLGGEPKTENWFIANASPGASLIVGLKRGITRNQFETALLTNTLEECVHRFPVSQGDSILVQSGRIHAIDAGNLILEIQQNSDTTYRVYDWGRVDLNGKPRQTHVSESLESIKWDDFEPAPLRASTNAVTIANTEEFQIRRIPLATSGCLRFPSGDQVRILSIVSGNIRLTSEHSATICGPGENLLLPFSAECEVSALTDTTLLVTEGFT